MIKPFTVKIHLITWIFLTIAVLTGQFLQLISLFLIVLLHELGHILVAQYFGWRISELMILPFGGVVHITPPGRENGWEELGIAIAGPMINGLLTMLSYSMFALGMMNWDTTLFFMLGNLSIALFNLLPIYPLDGGRIVQVLLSLYIPFKRAILISLYASMVFVLILFTLSFWRLSLGFSLWMILPYLLIMIVLELRRLPYRFISFLLNRFELHESAFPRISYQTVKRETTIKQATEGMYRHRYHFFMLRKRRLQNHPILFSEQRVLHEYFVSQQPMKTFEKLQKSHE